MWRSGQGLSEAWTVPIARDTTAEVSATRRRVTFAGSVEVRRIEAPTKRLVAGPSVSIATWNIRSGRNGGLEAACRSLASQSVDLAVLQETKLTGGIYTRRSSDYNIVASEASSDRQGGVALCWKESRLFEVEETKFFGPNVVAFRLLTGRSGFYVVGCYIPPSDLLTLQQIESAWDQCPNKFIPVLMGDLNVDLEDLSSERDIQVAEWCDAQDITCISRHFRQRRRRRSRGRWTWRQRRLGRWVSSHPDYFLTTPRGRKRLRPHHSTWEKAASPCNHYLASSP